MTPLRITVVFLVLLRIGTRLFAQAPEPTCDWKQFQQNAADLRAARDAARKIVSSDKIEGATNVPPEAIKQIQQFKNSLYAALEDYFRCQTPAVPSARALQLDLYTRFSLPEPLPPKDTHEDTDSFTGLYLAGITFTVQTVPDARNLVAVLTEFGIPYGEDAELDIFSLQGGAWKPVVNFTSQPYKSIYGAFEAFDYKISPPDTKNAWFVATTHINPWPSSCWRTLFVDALRPDQIGMIGELFHDEQWGYVCDDVPPYLRSVTADTFQVRFSVTSMDESVLSSVRVMTYKVRDDEVVRIRPFAANPVNFVDEWLRTDWLHAGEWSATTHREELRREHQKEHKKEGEGDFTAFRSCSSASLKEVEFDEVERNGRNHFFLVRQNGDIFQMVRVSNHHNPSCKGPDRLAAVKDR